MCRLCKGILVTFLLFAGLDLASQVQTPKGKWDYEDANEHYKNYNFVMALPMYKELCRREPNETEYHYRAAYCYLHTWYDKAAAVPYLEKAVKDPKCKPDSWYWLGKAYSIALKFEQAEKALTKYKTLVPKDKVELDKTDHLIDQIHNAQTLTKYPINITFTNAGPEVNSEFPDYYPWITSDEQTLFFTSRRKGSHASSVEADGYYSSDGLFATVMDGKWAKAQNLGNGVNTSLDEQVVGIKPDGSQLIVYIDHIDQLEDLYKTYRKNNAWAKLEPIGENVNKEKEYSGSIFETDDGPVLYFVRRDPKTSIGEKDIYTARMLPTGQWGLAQNIGPNINTKYNEEFPWLSVDGKTLYFSSEGHSSMGGYDLFKSIWDEEKQEWSKPINLGYPLNTPDDEAQISILPDNRAGYISAVRPEGMGERDIYRIKFEDNEQKFNVYRGRILTSDSAKSKPQATLVAVNQKTNDEITFTSNKITGRYIMALLPGIYKVTVSADGYADVNETVVVYEFGVARPETVKDYVLMKK